MLHGNSDAGTLAVAGRQPAPFRSFVLKIHSRCNLRCDYCYIYTTKDQAWRSRPRSMTSATASQAAFRIAEHAATHSLRHVDVVLHGGEPLLAGPDMISDTVSTIRAALGNDTQADISIQTNGLLLNEKFLDLLESLDVKIGLSLDGDADMHDQHRRYPDGRSSYDMVTLAVRRLARYPALFSGFLCVIDLHNDPVRAYEALLRFSPPNIDFLLPHGNWSAPPPRRPARATTAPYGDWLIQIFDRWYRAADKETSIRLFEEIINLLLGGSSWTEEIGLSPVTVIVIESDGFIEGSDMLTTAYPGAGATGLHVATDPFDAALTNPHVAARQTGLRGLAAQCQACPVGRVCGGGLYTHRYQAGNGFDNPSVYCPDLYHLITHVRDQVVADLNRSRPSSV